MRFTKLTKFLLHAGMIATLFTLATPAAAKEKDDSSLTLESYEVKEIQGWTVHIEKAANEHPKFNQAITTLENQLKEIEALINPEIVTQLKLVPIWLNKDIRSRACYHPSVEWLKENNRLPEKARSVELQSVDSYISSSMNQPMLMLHELSHAFHHRVHDFKHPVITEAFDKAVASKSYEKVKHISGKIVKHYALTDEKEYFAEATEAYFGKNDYYPFTREELKSHDPIGYAMIETVWKVK